MKLPKNFNKLDYQKQKDLVADKLQEARRSEKFWVTLSRQLASSKSKPILVDFDRPDLDAMK